ncbi:hypothetical protein ACIBEF_27025, partial [Micromonospora sp. NPDC050795]
GQKGVEVCRHKQIFNTLRLCPHPGVVRTYSSSPEEQFAIALRYLDARVRDQARDLIEKAVAGGFATQEVQFYRLIALLSGRTLRQLAPEELDRLTAICVSLPRLDRDDEWTAGLRVIRSLLEPVRAAETDLVIKEIDALQQPQRDGIYGHLEALLEGVMQDEMWRKSVGLANSQRFDGDRLDRVWKFFHPKPAQPRTLPVQPAAVPLGDWLRVGAGAAFFALALVQIVVLVAARGSLDPVLGLLAGLIGLIAFSVGGADRHYRGTRLRTKEAQIRPPQQRRRDAPPRGFARNVDRLFERYFRRYVPEGTDRSYWRAQTAGIQRSLRDEVVDLYREQRIEADRIAWLVRHPGWRRKKSMGARHINGASPAATRSRQDESPLHRWTSSSCYREPLGCSCRHG